MGNVCWIDPRVSQNAPEAFAWFGGHNQVPNPTPPLSRLSDAPVGDLNAPKQLYYWSYVLDGVPIPAESKKLLLQDAGIAHLLVLGKKYGTAHVVCAHRQDAFGKGPWYCTQGGLTVIELPPGKTPGVLTPGAYFERSPRIPKLPFVPGHGTYKSVFAPMLLPPTLFVRGVSWQKPLSGPFLGTLGATPLVVKKWFPERTEAEWNSLDEADKDSLLKQAQTVEAKYNATISEYKAQGACDATKPGRLAGALRQMLINKGADVQTLGPNDNEFGISECSAWYSLFGASPTIEDAKQAIYAMGLTFNSATPTYGWMHLTLANFCGSVVKLPSCGAPGGPAPQQCDAGYQIDASGNCVPIGPVVCKDQKDCPPGFTCVMTPTGFGECQPGAGGGAPPTGGAPSEEGTNLGWLLGIAAAIGAIFIGLRPPKTGPQPARARLRQQRRRRAA